MKAMDPHIESLYKHIDEWIPAGTVDFSRFAFMKPWDIGLVSLSAIKHQAAAGDGKIVLPENSDLCSYLKRMHFQKILTELGCTAAATTLEAIPLTERENVNIQEILHCRYIADFSARLGHFERMFKNFGLNEEDTNRAVVIVGELGNNVFDHNLGNWPTNFSGAIIAAQNYRRSKRIEMIVADAGVGFLGSLRAAYPELRNDVEAIKKGLAGHSGWIGVQRGNGLKTVQQWTIENFHGILTIHSGSGLVEVNEHGIEAKETIPILGTLAQFVIYYE